MRTAFAANRPHAALALVPIPGLLICGLMVGALTASVAAAPSEQAQGKRLFDRDCASCHQIGPGATSLSGGPALNGIIGMPAADEPGFSYSVANQKCGIIWSAQTFDAFVADPGAVIPGTTMAYAGLKLKADRQALFAYVSRFDATGATR